MTKPEAWRLHILPCLCARLPQQSIPSSLMTQKASENCSQPPGHWRRAPLTFYSKSWALAYLSELSKELIPVGVKLDQVQNSSYMRMFFAALPIIAKYQQTPRCLSMGWDKILYHYLFDNSQGKKKRFEPICQLKLEFIAKMFYPI